MKVDNLEIKSLRQERGWTQQHLADVVGLSLRTIQRIEKNGDTSLDTISALCSVFEVEREKIVKQASPPQNESQTIMLNAPLLLAIGFVGGTVIGGFCVYWMVSI